jgi:hypothetical protein
VLAAIATLMAVGGVLDALWRVVHGDLVGLVTLPLGLLFWYWIGVGAWRRAVQHAQLPISRRDDATGSRQHDVVSLGG